MATLKYKGRDYVITATSWRLVKLIEQRVGVDTVVKAFSEEDIRATHMAAIVHACLQSAGVRAETFDDVGEWIMDRHEGNLDQFIETVKFCGEIITGIVAPRPEYPVQPDEAGERGREATGKK